MEHWPRVLLFYFIPDQNGCLSILVKKIINTLKAMVREEAKNTLLCLSKKHIFIIGVSMFPIFIPNYIMLYHLY